ncbi:phospholipase D-like domain-containing protein [Flexivirga caeni]|uniref:phospholipase D n=1 Tax=Flexivirga caeni TaxID=2294115 RepID=A0A3M9LXA5_9MICO|nr:phospholipase D-like domain-containing protein [Flexivirga caeni]RNI17946.1 cardiolipin synthase [Flexivirga caeni]
MRAHWLVRTVAAATTVAAAAFIPSACVAHAADRVSPAWGAPGAGRYRLVALPDQGENSIYDFVESARKSIDITIYELRDPILVNDLVAKEKAGVNVRVIFDGQHSWVDGPAYTALQNAGAGVTYSSPAFVYTHQKTITVDDRESYISTGNFDDHYYATTRDYGVFDTDRRDVSAIEAVFDADYAKQPITPSDGADLVWSPTDSQAHLLTLINSAKKSLDVEEEEFGDPALVGAVIADAKRGVAVRVVVENDYHDYNTELNEVTAAGGKVATYTSPSDTAYYIHAKAIVVDAGTRNERVFVGSENFSDNSLNHNRELGLIINDPSVTWGVERAFDHDFEKSATNSVTVMNPGTQTSAIGSATSLQAQAYDIDGGALTYSAAGLPAGLSIDPSTGLISGTPSTAGFSWVTVTATDATGAASSTTFCWLVPWQWPW